MYKLILFKNLEQYQLDPLKMWRSGEYIRRGYQDKIKGSIDSVHTNSVLEYDYVYVPMDRRMAFYCQRIYGKCTVYHPEK